MFLRELLRNGDCMPLRKFWSKLFSPLELVIIRRNNRFYFKYKDEILLVTYYSDFSSQGKPKRTTVWQFSYLDGTLLKDESLRQELKEEVLRIEKKERD